MSPISSRKSVQPEKQILAEQALLDE